MKKTIKKIRYFIVKKIRPLPDSFFYARKSISLKIKYAFFSGQIFFLPKNDSKEKSTIFYYSKKKVIYLIVSKSACTSLEMALKKKINREEKTQFDEKQYPQEYYKFFFKQKIQKSNFYKFTFVRNPFSRIVSCFNDKVQKGFYTNKNNYFFLNYQPKPHDNNGFKTFLKKIDKIPDAIADHHFQSQYAILFYKNQPLYDYVGKIEDFPKSFEFIRKKFNLEKLGHHNSTAKTTNKKWQDFYDQETMDFVYKRYEKDFITWYPNAYKQLLDYKQNIKKK